MYVVWRVSGHVIVKVTSANSGLHKKVMRDPDFNAIFSGDSGILRAEIRHYKQICKLDICKYYTRSRSNFAQPFADQPIG